jgi:hypothetical protein
VTVIGRVQPPGPPVAPRPSHTDHRRRVRGSEGANLHRLSRSGPRAERALCSAVKPASASMARSQSTTGVGRSARRFGEQLLRRCGLNLGTNSSFAPQPDPT